MFQNTTGKINMCMNGSRMDNYCAQKKAYESQYKKVATGGNDPSISRAMRYSQLARSGYYRCPVTSFKSV